MIWDYFAPCSILMQSNLCRLVRALVGVSRTAADRPGRGAQVQQVDPELLWLPLPHCPDHVAHVLFFLPRLHLHQGKPLFVSSCLIFTYIMGALFLPQQQSECSCPSAWLYQAEHIFL